MDCGDRWGKTFKLSTLAALNSDLYRPFLLQEFQRLQHLWKAFGDCVQRATVVFVAAAGTDPENVLRIASETQFKPLNKCVQPTNQSGVIRNFCQGT
jgi:hypothetical protein